jgi:hypothetical protein
MLLLLVTMLLLLVDAATTGAICPNPCAGQLNYVKYETGKGKFEVGGNPSSCPVPTGISFGKAYDGSAYVDVAVERDDVENGGAEVDFHDKSATQ